MFDGGLSSHYIFLLVQARLSWAYDTGGIVCPCIHLSIHPSIHPSAHFFNKPHKASIWGFITPGTVIFCMYAPGWLTSVPVYIEKALKVDLVIGSTHTCMV